MSGQQAGATEQAFHAGADDWAQRVEAHTRKANAYAGACCDELLAGNVEIALRLAVRCRDERVQLLIAIEDADHNAEFFGENVADDLRADLAVL